MRLFLIGLPVAAATVFALLYLVANSAVYYPIRYPEGWWDKQAGEGAEEVWITTSDGVRLNAWWIAAPNARLATVFFHGNGGNLTHRIAHMRAIAAAGSSLLIPDYRGYGKSQGSPSESGLYADATYAWLIARGLSPDRIVIHGESLGTAVAVDLAARKPCAAVILEAPFNSASQLAAGLLPVVGPLVMRKFDTKRKIGAVRAPLLVMHGDRDEVIPYRLGQDLFDAAPEPKNFWTVKGAGHNDLVEIGGDEYRDKLRRLYGSI